MSGLRELYQEMILDHGRRPRNFRLPEAANRTAEGHNPLCGDRLTVRLELDGERIRDIGFRGSGCAISQASASIMTEAVKGRTVPEARELFARFHAVVTGKEDPAGAREVLGKLAVFAGVVEFPMRVKCATLAWHTLDRALSSSGGDPVSTE